jgi:hypothetical protein
MDQAVEYNQLSLRRTLLRSVILLNGVMRKILNDE